MRRVRKRAARSARPLRADQALHERALQDEPTARVADRFQEREASRDAAFPGVRALMHELRHVRFADRPQFDESHARRVQVQDDRETTRLRGHRIADASIDHHRRRADGDRHVQAVVVRRDGEREQARLFGRAPKKARFMKPTRFSTLPFCLGTYGGQRSMPPSYSSIARASVAFHTGRLASRRSTTVVGLSNTARCGTPPLA